jgi:hypothetical protein
VPETPPIDPGLRWFNCSLPTESKSWPVEDAAAFDRYRHAHPCAWGGGRIYFFCDLHADADAFLLSLIASGGVAKTGAADGDLELTEAGKRARFIIGGDCLDKGPQNLRLLEVIYTLYQRGAEVEILAGNHDVRTYMGIHFAERKEPLLDHLFVRMGRRAVPFLKEIYDGFVVGEGTSAPVTAKSAAPAVAALLYPDNSWYQRFPRLASQRIPAETISYEVRRIGEKTDDFHVQLERSGMTLEQIHVAMEMFRSLFFDPKGRYAWFFDRMKIAHQQGNLLFVHGGVDDVVAGMIRDHGLTYLNEAFWRTLHHDPFELYYGVLGNVLRTRYREQDFPLTAAGVQILNSCGIHAMVHGHQSQRQGQQLVISGGILQIQCDTTIDRNSRERLGMVSPGGAVTVFTEAGDVRGISTDYPYIKVLDLA